MPILLKYIITAALVVAASEVAKRSDRLGALITSLPLVTLLTLVWLQVERQGVEKLANHARYTFWYVALTLPFFLLFAWLLPRWGFGWALGAAAAATLAFFLVCALALRPLGIELIP